MARSVLNSFVSGTRQMLAAQLFISVGAVALAGWTLAVTNELIRERDRLQGRVMQLEETLVANDIVVPSTATVVAPARPQRAQDVYPPSVTLPEGSETAPELSQTPTAEPSPQPNGEPPLSSTSPQSPPTEAEQPAFNPGRILSEIFTPAPLMRTVVLHARSREDAGVAQRIASELAQAANVRVAVEIMPPRDQRESGYAYFDGRQSRAAANLMGSFHDIARRNQIPAWSAQLRGQALPAQGEYTADRLDIVLPPLQAPQPQRINPSLLQRDRQILIEPRQDQQQQPVIR